MDYDPIIAEMLATEDRMMKVAVAKYMPVLKPAFFSKLEAMAAAAPAAEKKRYEQLGTDLCCRTEWGGGLGMSSEPAPTLALWKMGVFPNISVLLLFC